MFLVNRLENLKNSVKKEKAYDEVLESDMIPKLSIVVPVYNVEKYLPQCLDSLIHQTLKEIEIILVNDGSTDDSGLICNMYAKKDHRIKVYSKTNGGLSDARNYGLSKVNTPVVGFVDSDDYVDVSMFQTLLDIKEKSNSEIAVCGIKMTSLDNEVYSVRTVEKEMVLNRHDAMRELLKSKRISNSVCNKIFDVAIFDGINFPLNKLYEDEYVTYRLFDMSNSVVLTNKTFYYYRLTPNSITHKKFSEREFDRIYASQEKIEYIQQRYPDLVSYAQRYLVYDCVMSLSKMTIYKEEYNILTRDNIRKNLMCFLNGDYSKGTKVFAVIASLSPRVAIKLYKLWVR